MEKNETFRTAFIAALGTAVLLVAVFGLMFAAGWIGLKGADSQSAQQGARAGKAKYADEEITMICDLNYSVPGDTPDAQHKVYKEMAAAGIDYKAGAGWYQGIFSISESRKGALTVKGSKVMVSRPAMFERFGTMVTGEQFTFDRDTGEFIDQLTVKDGRKLEIIKGYCGQLIKAPF
ncbi:MAG: hypothetical protein WCK83_01595 [Burkholderiales bacterium]|nr:hypothetical protein [Burkholderiales bacterium]